MAMAPYRFDVVSLAPHCFDSLLQLGVLGRAFSAGIAELHRHNPRDFAVDRYRKVDDEPYGGGAGMVLKPDPVFAAVESIPRREQPRVLLMSPQGQPLQQRDCQRWARDHDQLLLLCGITKALMSGFAPWPMKRCRSVILCSRAANCRQ